MVVIFATRCVLGGAVLARSTAAFHRWRCNHCTPPLLLLLMMFNLCIIIALFWKFKRWISWLSIQSVTRAARKDIRLFNILSRTLRYASQNSAIVIMSSVCLLLILAISDFMKFDVHILW